MNEHDSAGSGESGVTIVDIWAWSVEPTATAADLVGYSVEATDGAIGKIDEATQDAGRSHVIVDTGTWIFGKKVVLPAGVIQRVDADTETVFVSRSKDEIKNAPEYDAERGVDEDYQRSLTGHYSR